MEKILQQQQSQLESPPQQQQQQPQQLQQQQPHYHPHVIKFLIYSVKDIYAQAFYIQLSTF